MTNTQLRGEGIAENLYHYMWEKTAISGRILTNFNKNKSIKRHFFTRHRSFQIPTTNLLVFHIR